MLDKSPHVCVYILSFLLILSELTSSSYVHLFLCSAPFVERLALKLQGVIYPISDEFRCFHIHSLKKIWCVKREQGSGFTI